MSVTIPGDRDIVMAEGRLFAVPAGKADHYGRTRLVAHGGTSWNVRTSLGTKVARAIHEYYQPERVECHESTHSKSIPHENTAQQPISPNELYAQLRKQGFEPAAAMRLSRCGQETSGSANTIYGVLSDMYLKEPAHFRKALEQLAREDKNSIPQVYDKQTGLYSKAYFEAELLAEKIQETRRTGEQLCYAIIDIDDFHNYNEKHGHDQGDRIISNIADIIIQNTRHEDRYDTATPRKKDAAARMPAAGRIGGGEEFGILYDACGLEGAVKACERLRRKISEQTGVTVSIGIAEYTPGMSMSELKIRADKALYGAKEYGKNQTRVFGKYQTPVN